MWRKERDDRDNELERELRDHLELDAEARQERGASEEDARYAARRDFGNVARVKEVTREMWGWGSLERFWQDVRYGLRQISRNPGFAAVAILTLALGIGANTAIFSIVNAVFLRPLPFPESNRMFFVLRSGNRIGGTAISIPIYLAWKEKQGVFDSMGLVAPFSNVTLTGNGEPEQVPGYALSSEIFSVLRVQPALGRGFQSDETKLGGPRAAILSDALWRRKYSADPNILGQSITVSGTPRTVVGVMPADFDLPMPIAHGTQVWLSMQLPISSQNPSNGYFCLGRLRDGVTREQAQAAHSTPIAGLHEQYPNMIAAEERGRLLTLRQYISRRVGNEPLLLLGAVGLVLLIACANVANLFLARAASRRREIATRAALGASRGRIVRQLLTESILLALVGGVAGVVVCTASFQTVLSLVPAGLMRVGQISMDAYVFAFAALLSILTGATFGMAPALQASAVNLNTTLKEGTSGAGISRRRGVFRSALVVCEVGLSLVLVTGAVLLCESFFKLLNVNPGFTTQNMLVFDVSLPRSTYDTSVKAQAFYDEASAKFSSLPGLQEAAYAGLSPLAGGAPDFLFSIEERGATGQRRDQDAEFRYVSPNYFRTLNVPIISGRGFTSADAANAEPVILINQAMARKFWPNEDPLGQHIWFGKPMGQAAMEPAPRRIVGVVGDVRDMSLAEVPIETMYMPFAQRNGGYGYASFILHTGQDPRSLVPAIRSALQQMAPNLPIASIKTMEEAIATSLTSQRFMTILLVSFGGMALLIATVGVYGVISYSVAQRTNEIGIRVAMGATRGKILRMVMGQGVRLALLGSAVGLGSSYWLMRFLSDMLYGVKPTDPLTLAAVTVALVAVALAACWIPARRATRVDPLTALRYE